MLEYLTDITEEELQEEEGECGFRLTFHFAKNPYFSHDTLVRASGFCRGWGFLWHLAPVLEA